MHSRGDGYTFTQSWESALLWQPTVVSDITNSDKDVMRENQGSLVASIWMSQPWYPLLLQLLNGIPFVIPTQENMVISPITKLQKSLSIMCEVVFILFFL